MSAEARIVELGLELPAAPAAMGVYKPVLVSGGLAYLSGHGPLRTDGSLICGKVGGDLTEEEGKAAARQVGLAMLATLKAGLGSLDRVKRVVKVLGLVNCPTDFATHPAVINGCSELFRDVFGEDEGVGTRSAFGAGSLPGNIAVEIEGAFEVRE